MTLRDGETLLTITKNRLKAGCAWAWADIAVEMEPDEPAAWAETLARLAEDGAGAVTLRSHSGQLQATFAMAKKSELHVSLVLQNDPDYLNELRLFLNLPQSDLIAIIDAVRSICSTQHEL
ncbi:hypothetical protein BH11ARM2_BH11ARM2_33460 [soil metagenome]